MDLPMHSHVLFGSIFMFDPRSRITLSISDSPICVVNLISLPMHNACFPSFETTCHFLDLMHLMISYCRNFTTLLSCSSFIHVSKKVVSIEGSIRGSSWSLLPEVEAFVKLFLASMNVSFAHSKSNLGSFVRALRTQELSFDYLPLSSPVVIPLLSIMFTFGSSSRSSDHIIYKFWVEGG